MRRNDLLIALVACAALVAFPSPAWAPHNAGSCNTVTGSDLPNTLNGTNGCDDIFGRGGGDTINSMSGDDDPHGEDQNDTIYGGPGVDYMFGGPHDDSLKGNDGNDHLQDEASGTDTDTFCGSADLDYADGQDGDTLDGYWGVESINKDTGERDNGSAACPF